eukprot:50846-Rhodomonas_salina.5
MEWTLSSWNMGNEFMEWTMRAAREREGMRGEEEGEDGKGARGEPDEEGRGGRGGGERRRRGERGPERQQRVAVAAP